MPTSRDIYWDAIQKGYTTDEAIAIASQYTAGTAPPWQVVTTVAEEDTWDWLGGVGEALKVGLSGYTQILKITETQKQAEFQNQLARLRLQQGLTAGAAPPGIGGLNIMTLLILGGGAILLVLLLKK